MIIDLSRLKEFFSLKNHTHSEYLTSHQDISGKVDKTNGASQMTDSNASGYTNIGSNLSTQASINSAINTRLGDIITIINGTGEND